MSPLFSKLDSMSHDDVRVIIYWSGYNSCALRINSLLKVYNKNEVLIISDSSYLSFDMVAKFSEFKIINITDIDHFYDYNFSNIDLFIQTGWSNHRITKLGRYFKEKYQSKIYITVDNIIKNSIKQFLGKFYIRLYFDKYVDKYLVPGIESLKLLVRLGVCESKISVGYYGGNDFFYFFDPLVPKKNTILYVGEISKRKGVDTMIEVFHSLQRFDWELVLIGRKKDLVLEHTYANIKHFDFMPPDQIGNYMRSAKLFVLASRLDHWGTVVCEAAMCGCALLVSHKAGVAVDLVEHGLNGFICFDEKNYSKLLKVITSWDNLKFSNAQSWSLRKSQLFISEKYLDSI